MEKIKLEIKNNSFQFSFDKLQKILFQMKNNICKIYRDNKIKELGFLCNIPSPDNSNLIPILIIYNYKLKENDIIKININNKDIEIKIDKSRKKLIYTYDKLNISIIEIKPINDKIINNFLKINKDSDKKENILKEINENKTVYIFYYQNENIKFIYGLLTENKDNEINIINNEDLSFSPIFSMDTFEIIGFYYGNPVNENRKGIFIENIINEFYKKNYNTKNEIRIILKIEKEDINKDIYYLDNSNNDKNSNEHLKELNESNVDIFINNKKYKYKKFFKTENDGNYAITLIFKNIINDCSYMFFGCENLIYIDLSSFNTINIINTSNMFSGCKKLINIDLSSFNTKNVKNMSQMFYDCNKLIRIDLSFFNTKNVENMNGIFSGCKNLIDIDLSSFDINKVTDMKNMFANCEKITYIDLSSFYFNNDVEINNIYKDCNDLKKLKINKINSEKLTNEINENVEIIKS